jgi:[ribosomal protein S5]-alanine N-acetyltransferase
LNLQQRLNLKKRRRAEQRMEIIFEGITLRPWLIEDVPALAKLANNKKIADNIRDSFPYPYSLKDARKWIRSVLPILPHCNFAILSGNEIVGNIGLVTKENIYRKNIEIGYFISEQYWGRGFATLGIKAITSYAFNNFGVIRVYAEVFSDNIGSRRALEKAGFIHEATLKNAIIKNDEIKDSCIYSVLKENFKYFLT